MRAMSPGLTPALSSAATGWQPLTVSAIASAAAYGSPRRNRRFPRCSVIAIGLVVRMGGGEGVELHASGVDPGDGRIRRKVEPVTFGIDHLRYQRDVGEPRPVAVAEFAGAAIRSQQSLQRFETAGDPIIVPGLDRRLVVAERPA